MMIYLGRMCDSPNPAVQKHAKIDPGGASIHETNRGKNMNFSNNMCACRFEITGGMGGG